MQLKLAWRNIWRNRRRTYITIASILFAVLFASLMEALQKGAWDNMINNVVNYYVGYAQIHAKGYWDEQSLDKAFPYTDSIQNLAATTPEIETVLPRLEAFALASVDENTNGVLVAGIDPEKETRMTDLQSRVVAGAYLDLSDQAALVGAGVAEHLNLAVGDTLVLISQGYHGVNAAGLFPVKGIVRFASPELNKQLVFLPLPTAQHFFGAEGLITTATLQIDDQDDIAGAVAAVKAQLGTEAYEVMDWKELIPDLLQARALDSAGNYIVYVILYLIIAFGIFGTILMMSKEREYEFGLLIAIGMRRFKLSSVIWLEVVILGLLGALAGILVSIPIVWYFYRYPIRFSGNYAGLLEKFGFEPIFPAALDPANFFTQALIVFIITSLLALYPLLKISRIKPVEAMRS